MLLLSLDDSPSHLPDDHESIADSLPIFFGLRHRLSVEFLEPSPAVIRPLAILRKLLFEIAEFFLEIAKLFQDEADTGEILLAGLVSMAGHGDTISLDDGAFKQGSGFYFGSASMRRSWVSVRRKIVPSIGVSVASVRPFTSFFAILANVVPDLITWVTPVSVWK